MSEQDAAKPEDVPYGRDLSGYGATPPHPRWPGDARIAVQFVVNYEEGGENCILHGDASSEVFLSDIANPPAILGGRNMNIESMYEYGSRAGFWRLLRLFEKHGFPFTCFGVGMALLRNPPAVAAMLSGGHEIATHGWRWIDYQHMPEETERAHLHRAIEAHAEATGERPYGWYLGRCSPNTRRLVAEEGGFLYDADSYADDLPYWDTQHGRPQLIVPYSLECNDMRFATGSFTESGQFFAYLRDSFDVLYEEGAVLPKMMSIGLHCRLAGRPGRFAGLARFMEHVARHDRVWVCRRIDIARHWHAEHKEESVLF
jgi:putative urate catabolism protein